MASIPNSATLSPAYLLTLGMFVFGMDTLAYDGLRRRTSWRHGTSERFGARPASQYLGPGEDNVSIAGRLMPEVAGSFSAIETIRTMADTGDDYPLVDGLGRVLGHFRIVALEQEQLVIMAGGLPRGIDFTIELERVD